MSRPAPLLPASGSGKPCTSAPGAGTATAAPSDGASSTSTPHARAPAASALTARHGAAPAAAAVAAAVQAARRYQALAPALIERVAAEEVSKARTHDEAVKRVKRRLHQVHGAYAGGLNRPGALAELQMAAADGPAALQEACRRLMRLHASTRERLPVIEHFYGDLFRLTGRPTRLLDLACGLAPLALPWMPLAEGAFYHACDVDGDVIAIVDRFLALWGIAHRAEIRDVTYDRPREHYDVVLLLKAIPCLEQQHRGVGRQLLAALPARHIAVSFPTRSLGGRSKGMGRHYETQLRQMIEGLSLEVAVLSYPLETVYLLSRP